MRPIALVLGLVAGCVAAHEPPDRELVTFAVPPPTSEVDLLFVIDDAGNVITPQHQLAAALPRLFAALTTGDHDGDGEAERRAVSSLHVAFATSDLGLGDASEADEFSGCWRGPGDDGVFMTRTSGGPFACEAEFPARTFAWEAGGDLDPFVADLSCMARMGKNGCNLEQLLEAALKALSPAEPQPWAREDYVPPVFHHGEPGHGDTANHGFLRAASVLAIVPFADDDDGSTPRHELYWVSNPALDDPLGLRASRHPELLHPIERYVEGFLQLRAHPGRLVFAPIGGMPLAVDPETTSCDAILADPRMAYVEDPWTDPPSWLAPVCDAPWQARPARRTFGVACELERRGAHIALDSFCRSSFEQTLSRVADRIADALEADCLPLDPAAFARCELVRRSDCDALGWPTAEGGACVVPRAEAAAPGWYVEEGVCPIGTARVGLVGLPWTDDHELRCAAERRPIAEAGPGD